jgi:microcompartment protein CcmK/EutM
VRSTLLVGFALAWISSCVGCGTQTPANVPRRELAARLEAETVAMVQLVDSDGNPDPDGKPAMYCAGVWVGPHVFVSAAHCAKYATPATQSPLDELFKALGLPPPGFNPIGASVAFSGHGDVTPGHLGYWLGRIVAYDDDVDLLAVEAHVPPHPFAHLSQGAEDGDRVEIVGHPSGHLWTYVEGVIASVRPEEPNANGTPMPTLQIEGPVWHGNSGGGAFDVEGELVGISSYLEQNAPGFGFYVYAPAIRLFLGRIQTT